MAGWPTKVSTLAQAEIFVTTTAGVAVTGLSNSYFTKLLSKDGVNNATAITVVEVGNGRYNVSFTPGSVGFWELTVIDPTNNKYGWTEDFDVTVDGLPSVIAIRTEIDSNSTKLASLDARIPTALVNGGMKSFILDITNNVIKELTFADSAISDRVLATDVDTYQAKVWLFDDNASSVDRYAVVWFKNSQPILTGVTSVTIQVIKATDGTDLVATASMTQIGSTGLFKYNETVNRIVAGAVYYIKVQATIDSATRTFIQQVGRDTA